MPSPSIEWSLSIVCRDGELNDGSTGAAVLQVCLEDEWLTLENSPLVANGNFPVTNLQLGQSGNEVELAWEPPLDNEAIISYNVECSTTTAAGVRLASSLSVAGGDPPFSVSLPLPAPEASMYRCCVTTIVQGTAGVRIASETCQDELTSPFTPLPCPPTVSCLYPVTLILILGVLAGLFFMALLIVSFALVLFICTAASRKKGSLEATDGGLTEYELKT